MITQQKESLPPNLGPYRILEEVGTGGLGRVFKAIDERNGKTVAIKVLHQKFVHNKKFLGIFHRELLIMASLHHKHIVSYLDSYFHPPVVYIVTEFIDGWSGYSFFKKVGRLPPLVGLCVLIDMLQGIDHLHLHETIHSDLSAANYLIEKNGRVLVTDFGLACRFEIEDYKNYMVGTPGYYSPEHISESAIVPQTDFYCAGLILYELIVGKKAVPASTDRRKVLKSMKNIDFSLITSDDPKLEKKLVHLLSKALSYHPSRRFQSADEMMFACYEILKRYNIRYARYAILQFLIDQGFVKKAQNLEPQNIYSGFLPK